MLDLETMVVRLISPFKMAGVHGNETSGNEARLRHTCHLIAFEPALGQSENLQIPEIGANFKLRSAVFVSKHFASCCHDCTSVLQRRANPTRRRL